MVDLRYDLILCSESCVALQQSPKYQMSSFIRIIQITLWHMKCFTTYTITCDELPLQCKQIKLTQTTGVCVCSINKWFNVAREIKPLVNTTHTYNDIRRKTFHMP